MMSPIHTPVTLSIDCDTISHGTKRLRSQEDFATPSSKIQKREFHCPPTPRGKLCLTKTFFESVPEGLSLEDLFLPIIAWTDDDATINGKAGDREVMASLDEQSLMFQLKPRFSPPSADVFLPNFRGVENDPRGVQEEQDRDASRMPPPAPIFAGKTSSSAFRAKLPELAENGKGYARCA
jgi:hypothetical protein